MPDDSRSLATFKPPRLPYHPAIEERFGVSPAEWKALTEAIFPAAQSTDSVVLALSYCKARKIDPFKRVVHIVPVWDRVQKKMVDTIWPGIAEQRTTAFRTGQYAGADACVFGPDVEKVFEKTDDQARRSNIALRYPEWAQLTVYRMIQGQRVPVPGPRVYWMETYAKEGRNSDVPNDMWRRRAFGQLEKCAEAAALRRAFPEELGDEATLEERGISERTEPRDITPPPRPRREDFDPETGEINHKDGDPTNNEISNLEVRPRRGRSPKAAAVDTDPSDDRHSAMGDRVDLPDDMEPRESLADTVMLGLAGCKTPEDVDAIEKEHEEAIAALDHEDWVDLKSRIDARHAELSN